MLGILSTLLVSPALIVAVAVMSFSTLLRPATWLVVMVYSACVAWSVVLLRRSIGPRGQRLLSGLALGVLALGALPLIAMRTVTLSSTTADVSGESLRISHERMFGRVHELWIGTMSHSIFGSEVTLRGRAWVAEGRGLLVVAPPGVSANEPFVASSATTSQTWCGVNGVVFLQRSSDGTYEHLATRGDTIDPTTFWDARPSATALGAFLGVVADARAETKYRRNPQWRQQEALHEYRIPRPEVIEWLLQSPDEFRREIARRVIEVGGEGLYPGLGPR